MKYLVLVLLIIVVTFGEFSLTFKDSKPKVLKPCTGLLDFKEVEYTTNYKLFFKLKTTRKLLDLKINVSKMELCDK